MICAHLRYESGTTLLKFVTNNKFHGLSLSQDLSNASVLIQVLE